MGLHQRAFVCIKCDKATPPPRTGVCLCTVNGKDIIENATVSLCPLGKFRWDGFGDGFAWFTHYTRIARTWGWIKGKPYCAKCGERQSRWNRWTRWMFRNQKG